MAPIKRFTDLIHHFILISNLYLNHNDNVEVYTDGSLQYNYNTQAKDHMSSEWLILNSNNEIAIQAKEKIDNWPSSTRSELMAILHLILCIPMNRKVTIFTDSKAAIDSINNALLINTNGRNKARLWLKQNNSTIVSFIVDLVNSKNISLTLVKVRGHADNIGNNIVDIIAKEACNDKDSKYIRINNSQSACVIFRPT